MQKYKDACYASNLVKLHFLFFQKEGFNSNSRINEIGVAEADSIPSSPFLSWRLCHSCRHSWANSVSARKLLWLKLIKRINIICCQLESTLTGRTINMEASWGAHISLRWLQGRAGQKAEVGVSAAAYTQLSRRSNTEWEPAQCLWTLIEHQWFWFCSTSTVQAVQHPWKPIKPAAETLTKGNWEVGNVLPQGTPGLCQERGCDFGGVSMPALPGLWGAAPAGVSLGVTKQR